MTLHRWEVPARDLRIDLDPQRFPFATTDELADLDEIIGQARAVHAMDFGLQIQGQGYNLYVAGVPSTGRHSLVKGMIAQVAARQPVPDDWCYVHNFHQPNNPRALRLPAGQGREFQRDMERLIAALKSDLVQVFRSQDYEEQRQAFEADLFKARDHLMKQLKQRAKDYGFQITSSRQGIFATLLFKGEPVKGVPFTAGHPPRSGKGAARQKALHEALHTFFQQVRSIQEQVNQRIAELNHQVAVYATTPHIDRLRAKYRQCPPVLEYLQAVQQDIVEHLEDVLAEPEEVAELPGMESEPARRTMARYAVNVLVDHGQTHGAPLVEEANPTYANLVGRIARETSLGTLYTDFTLIRAGALLRANGGYLLVDVLDLLREPFAWEALKRCLKRQEVKIEDVVEFGGFIPPVGLTPEPIPLQVRVILVGTPALYPLLYAYDEDFRDLFKVKVDFDEQHRRTEDAPLHYGRFIARLCRAEGLRHFERGAVAAVLEQASRWVDHRQQISLQFGDLADLIREASYWAGREGRPYVARQHVQTAVQQRTYRGNLVEERLRELIAEGTLMVDVAGAVVGQINGLSTYDIGDLTFGMPSRITARVFLGDAGILNIEREVELSEESHSKGVLILSGYLGGRYARDIPLSLSATLCFEQSYAEVEGDSASAAELVALLSALADIPIDQGLALTGSVNQRGELQAISGVNAKIQGFYAVCKTLGLTGQQGVILPRRNLPHLVLADEVVEAVESGSFHIYAVSTIDEAMEILMRCPAGALQADGTYPAGSINAAVLERLRHMHERFLTVGTSKRQRRAGRARRSPLP